MMALWGQVDLGKGLRCHLEEARLGDVVDGGEGTSEVLGRAVVLGEHWTVVSVPGTDMDQFFPRSGLAAHPSLRRLALAERRPTRAFHQRSVWDEQDLE